MTDIQVRIRLGTGRPLKLIRAHIQKIIQSSNIANMYQDIIMKLQQNQHPGAAPPRPPGANPVANLLGAAAAGTGIPNSPSILHQVSFT